MASYTYDPARGEAVETSQLNNNEPGQERELDYQQVLDNAQQKSFDNAARNLTQRAIQKEQGIADDDVNPSLGKLKAESRLAEVQQELFNLQDSNPTKAALLRHEAEKLAGMLVGASAAEASETASQGPTGGEQAAVDLKAQYGEEAVTQTLSWAAETLDKSSSEALNEVLDTEEAPMAYEVMNTIRQNPDYVGTGEHHDFTEAEANEIINEYGEAGQSLVTISAMIGQGKLSRGDALRMVMRDPAALQAAFDAGRRGLMSWSI